MTAVAAPRLFVSPAPRPRAPVVLFCLPYAGAGPTVFHRWSAAMGPEVDVAIVALPGREGRFLEPPTVDIAVLAPAIVARAGGRPYALYGHSMGGRIAFEVVRELRRRGLPQPKRLCLGGSRPPELVEPLAGLSYAADDAMLDRLAGLGGLPDQVVANEELRELVTPIIRADLRWLDEYRAAYRPEPPLPVPLRVFAGADDPVARPHDMLHWLRHAGAGLIVRTEPGDHFFLHARLDAVVRVLRADLLGGATASPARPGGDEVHVWYGPAAGLAQPSDVDLRRDVCDAGGAVLAATTLGRDVGVAAVRLDAVDPRERAAYDRLAEADRPAFALRSWTAKRAVLRAAGLGAEPHRLSPDGWRVTHVPLPGAVGAVAHAPVDLRMCFVAEPY